MNNLRENQKEKRKRRESDYNEESPKRKKPTEKK